MVSLVYALSGHVRQSEPRRERPFSPEHPQWLYDELDASGDGVSCIHRILLSDGRIIEVPFVSAVVHEAAADAVFTRPPARQTA
jgi:hypothetical protein